MDDFVECKTALLQETAIIKYKLTDMTTEFGCFSTNQVWRTLLLALPSSELDFQVTM